MKATPSISSCIGICKIKVKVTYRAVPVFNWTPQNEELWGSGATGSCVLDLDIRLTSVIMHHFLVILTTGKESLVPTGLEAGWVPVSACML
jgi:hypothetical protein